MADKELSSNDQIIDLLRKILIIELAKQKVSQNDIARIVGIGSVKVNAILKYFKLKKST